MTPPERKLLESMLELPWVFKKPAAKKATLETLLARSAPLELSGNNTASEKLCKSVVRSPELFPCGL
jgi:hypothetical protein